VDTRRSWDHVARAHRIAILGGDGIGPEVVAEGLKVLDRLEDLEGFSTERSRVRPRWPAVPRHG
jgi:isocitrate/isopropylmalate dehydrogenase